MSNTVPRRTKTMTTTHGPGRKRRSGGFTLTETLGVIALFLLTAGISVWTYRSLAIHQRHYFLMEERVHRLRDELLAAHLRAQQGQRQEIHLNDPELNLEGAPSSVTFLPPYGKLGDPQPIRFRVGGQKTGTQSWWQFEIAPDGMVLCHPGNPAPGETPGATAADAPLERKTGNP